MHIHVFFSSFFPLSAAKMAHVPVDSCCKVLKKPSDVQGCVESYLYGMLAFCATSMLLELGIFVCSARGSVLDTAARRPVTPMLYLHIVVSFGEICWAFTAASTLLSPDFTCRSADPSAVAPAAGRTLVAMARGLVWATAALLLAPALGLLLSFDMCGINAAAAASGWSDANAGQASPDTSRSQSSPQPEPPRFYRWKIPDGPAPARRRRAWAVAWPATPAASWPSPRCAGGRAAAAASGGAARCGRSRRRSRASSRVWIWSPPISSPACSSYAPRSRTRHAHECDADEESASAHRRIRAY